MSISLKNVNITGGFWKKMQDKNINVTIDAVYDRFKETGRFDALSCTWKEGMDNKPHIFWDSDVAKWAEGAANIILKHDMPELLKKVEAMIDEIEKNQWEDGYFNSYYTSVEPENRFTVRANHELYCAGHLMEAAVSYYKATGRDRFLKLMERYADCIYKIFIEEKSAAFITPGHEEIEIALLRMYKATGKQKYLDMCKFFINERGKNDAPICKDFNLSYDQSHMPVREMKEATGHSVRALYLYTAMAGLAYETDDKELLDASKRLFNDITKRKMYITGGVGSTCIGETFTIDYDLPSETAYAETCAAIALMFFCRSLLLNEINSEYADTIERAMYNGMLSGISYDGKAFFYENPLRICLDNHRRNVSTYTKERLPITQRVEVFECSCCPPNLNRVLSSMENYIYSEKDGVYYVHQFMESMYSEGDIKIIQNTGYPENGEIKLSFEGVSRAAIRIPGWCDEYSINVPYEAKNGYAYIENPGDVEVSFKMEPKLYKAHMNVNDCAGKAALMYGPTVYCMEGADNNFRLDRAYIKKELNAEISYLEELDTQMITVDGLLVKTNDSLYSSFSEEFEETKIKLIPYRLFANRGESDMDVWIKCR